MEMVRYACAGLGSLAPLVAGHGGGVYVLEFADGTQYVGQAVSFVRRMAQHLHGGLHHRPWAGEVEAVSVMTLAEGDMSRWERRLIAEKRESGVQLRNTVLNVGGVGETAFDETYSTTDQQHWVTGGGRWDEESFRTAASRAPGSAPKLLTRPEAQLPAFAEEGSSEQPDCPADGGRAACDAEPRGGDRVAKEAEPLLVTRADFILEALALIISQTIPDAVALEKRYWTVSDWPSTGGGRFATLSVGNVELAYFPRSQIFQPSEVFLHPDALVLNLPLGTITDGAARQEDAVQPSDKEEDYTLHRVPSGIEVWGRRAHYPSVMVDQIMVPVAAFVSSDYGLVPAVRSLVIDLMRRSPASKFQRWHSEELVRQVYARAALSPESYG